MVDVNCNRRNSKLMHLFKQVNINAMSLMIHRVLLILLTSSIRSQDILKCFKLLLHKFLFVTLFGWKVWWWCSFSSDLVSFCCLSQHQGKIVRQLFTAIKHTTQNSSQNCRQQKPLFAKRLNRTVKQEKPLPTNKEFISRESRVLCVLLLKCIWR